MTTFIQLSTLFVCLLYKALGEGCCKHKSVGGINYTYVETTDLAPEYECLTNCLYSKDGEDNPATLYCFARGPLPVECNNPPVSDCPSGWWRIQQKCFKLSDTIRTWEWASTECSNISGASLASIDNEAQHELAHGLSGGETIWLGGSDSVTEGTWVWQSSGTVFTTNNTPVPGVYTNFIPGGWLEDRNTERANCLHKSSYPGGNWAPNTCSWGLRYLCEMTSSVSGGTASSATIPPPTPGLTEGQTIEPGCPSGWSRIQQKCFRLSDTRASGSRASAECSKIPGASLASIDNEAQQQVAWGLLETDLWGVWLGGSDSAIEGTWVWESSGTVFWTNDAAVPGVYNNFTSGYPNFGKAEDNCLMMRTSGSNSGGWITWTCTASAAFYLCEMKTSVSVTGCPTGWSRIQQKCFKVSDFNVGKNWTDASTECSKTPGGSLASIDNEAQQQFVLGLNRGEWLWLGGSDSVIEGTWEWQNSGTVFATNNTAIPGVYNNFYTDKAGQSSKAEELNCLLMSPYKGVWWQFNCKSQYNFICEVPALVSGM